jgi:hypothetical protein
MSLMRWKYILSSWPRKDFDRIRLYARSGILSATRKGIIGWGIESGGERERDREDLGLDAAMGRIEREKSARHELGMKSAACWMHIAWISDSRGRWRQLIKSGNARHLPTTRMQHCRSVSAEPTKHQQTHTLWLSRTLIKYNSACTFVHNIRALYGDSLASAICMYIFICSFIRVECGNERTGPFAFASHPAAARQYCAACMRSYWLPGHWHMQSMVAAPYNICHFAISFPVLQNVSFCVFGGFWHKNEECWSCKLIIRLVPFYSILMCKIG